MIHVTTSLEEMGFQKVLALVRQTDWHAEIPEAVFATALTRHAAGLYRKTSNAICRCTHAGSARTR